MTHRDIKGTNILVSTTGEAKLVDFGLAGIEGDDKKSSMQSQRTVDYSALERTCRSEKGDPRSDIFFLGCVFYQMLTGKVAMAETESKDMLAKMLKRSFGAIQPLSDSPYAPDPELCRIIEKMMKVDLRSRYQTMDEVVADLEAFDVARQGRPPPAARTGSSGEHDFLADIEALFMNRHAHLDPSPSPHPSPPRAARTAAARRDRRTGEESPASPARPTTTRPDPEAGGEVRASSAATSSASSRRPRSRTSSASHLSKMGYRVILVGDRRARRRAVPRGAPGRRDLRRRRPRPRGDRLVPRHARQGPRGRPRPRRPGPPRPPPPRPQGPAPDRRPARRPGQAGQDEADPGRPRPAHPGALTRDGAPLFMTQLARHLTAVLATLALAPPASAAERTVAGRSFTLPDGFTLDVAAGPPLVDRPITADFDELGRLYVADSSGSNDKVERPARDEAS